MVNFILPQFEYYLEPKAIIMKKYFKTPLLLVSLLFFTSCFRVQTVVTVYKDGSGIITEKVMMSKAFTEMMRSFGSSFGDPEEEKEPFSLYDEEELISEASGYGEGVFFKSGKEVKEKDWEGYTVTYTFEDISKVRLNTKQDEKVNTGMSSMDPTEEETKEDEFFYFTFNKGNPAELMIHRNEVAGKERQEEEDMMDAPGQGMDAMGKEMLKMFEGMRISMDVIVDGKIRETNATYQKGATITLMDMDFGEMMNNKDAFMELTKEKPETTEELEAFMGKFPGLKVELEQPIVVKFR